MIVGAVNIIGSVSSVGAPRLGPDVYNQTNAISKSNEANSLTDLTDTGSTTTVETVLTDNSAFAVKSETNTTPTSAGRVWFAIGGRGPIVGERYVARFSARHIGVGGDWKVAISQFSTGGGVSISVPVLSTDLVYKTCEIEFLFDNVNAITFVVVENNALNDGGVYIDNLEFLPVL